MRVDDRASAGHATDDAAERALRALLLQSCRLHDASASAVADAAHDIADWGALLRRAEALGALPPLLWTLNHTGVLAQLPPDARDAAQVSSNLERAGIRHVLLKGAALLARHYPAPTARHIDDVDVLVGGADRARTVATLASLGVLPRDDQHTHLHPLHPGRALRQRANVRPDASGAYL